MVGEEVPYMVLFRIAKWASSRSEFDSLRVEWFFTIGRHLCVVRLLRRLDSRVVSWAPPIGDVLKFNGDGLTRGKPGPSGIGGALHSSGGDVLVLFFKVLVVCNLMRQRLSSL